MRDIVYNCGYYSGVSISGPETGKKYVFKKYFVTAVDEKDADAILAMSYKDIVWCPRTPKNGKVKPFMEFEEWFNEESGSQKPSNVKALPEDYLTRMHL